jgi:hypothetical protein
MEQTLGRIPHYSGNFCMQHIPIEVECEHVYQYPNGIPTCTKCGKAEPLGEIKPVIAECGEAITFIPNPPEWAKVEKIDAPPGHHPEHSHDVSGSVTFGELRDTSYRCFPPDLHLKWAREHIKKLESIITDDSEANLKDACEELGEANDRIKELENRLSGVVLDVKDAINSGVSDTARGYLNPILNTLER